MRSMTTRGWPTPEPVAISNSVFCGAQCAAVRKVSGRRQAAVGAEGCVAKPLDQLLPHTVRPRRVDQGPLFRGHRRRGPGRPRASGETDRARARPGRRRRRGPRRTGRRIGRQALPLRGMRYSGANLSRSPSNSITHQCHSSTRQTTVEHARRSCGIAWQQLSRPTAGC